MKLKKEFIVHHTRGESLLVPTAAAGFSGLVKGNKTLGAILDLLKHDTTEAELLEAMKARFNAPEDVIAKDINTALTELRTIGAIEE